MGTAPVHAGVVALRLWSPRVAKPVGGHPTGEQNLGEFLHRTLAPRLFAAAAAAVVVLAYFRVASVPEATTPGPSYSWDTAIGEIVADIDATVAGLRMELAEQKTKYTKMYNDARLLEEKLTSTTSVNR